MVNSCLFGSRVGIVRLGHKQEWKLFVLSTQYFWICSKLSCWSAEVTWMRRTLFGLIVIVIVIDRMTRNDPLTKHEWSIRPRSAVDSGQWDKQRPKQPWRHRSQNWFKFTVLPRICVCGWQKKVPQKLTIHKIENSMQITDTLYQISAEKNCLIDGVLCLYKKGIELLIKRMGAVSL